MMHEYVQRVDELLKYWKDGFATLESRRLAGGEVSKSDVTGLLQQAASYVQKSGINLSAVSSESYRSAELLQVREKLSQPVFSTKTIPDDSIIGATKLNALQYAYVAQTDSNTRHSVLQSIHADSDFMPPVANPIQPVLASDVVAAQKPVTFDHVAPEANEKLLENLAPPSDIDLASEVRKMQPASMPTEVSVKIKNDHSEPKTIGSPDQELIAQMPVQVVQPQAPDPNIKLDALGRVIH